MPYATGDGANRERYLPGWSLEDCRDPAVSPLWAPLHDLPPTLLDVLLQSFADLRASAAAAGSDDEKLESALSTAEQIGVLEDAILHSNFFGARTLTARTLASSLVGSLARREPEDLAILNKYLHGVVESRSKEQGGQWPEFLDGGREAIATLS